MHSSDRVVHRVYRISATVSVIANNLHWTYSQLTVSERSFISGVSEKLTPTSKQECIQHEGPLHRLCETETQLWT